MPKRRFNIIVKAEKVADYTLTATDKSPKKLRCDLVPELRKQAFRILEDIVRANCLDVDGEKATESTRETRRALQEDALATLRVLDSFAEMANKHNYLTSKQFEYLTLLTQELYDMVKNWIVSDAKRKG
ncbi:MAG: four helix bundle protein [Clostridia bacterium]|nr:four helix bundle protein [Clostridia bacterium]